MARCIDAEKVINVMRSAYWNEDMHSAKDDPCVIDAMIDWSIRQVKDAPTEDVAPVRHARWIVNKTFEDYRILLMCPCCTAVFDIDKPKKIMYRYCPHCGAKMDEEDNEDD